MTAAAAFPSMDTLIQSVCIATGLSDFGEGNFRDGLQRFLTALQTELTLSEASVAQYIGLIKRRLTNRLELEAWYRAHPEINDVIVGRPVSVTGLPRTGTTAIANMLSQDEQFRCLRSWEQGRSCPPPILAEEETDPRRLAAIAGMERMAKEQPEMMALHLWDPNTTEEDVELLGLSFKAQQFILPMPKYHAWWRDTNLDETFAYQKRVIRLLQSRRPPNRWLFKAPAHNYHLNSYFKAYPDAKVIMTHRDPAQTIPSVISFVEALRPKELVLDQGSHGRYRAEHLRIGVERAMAARTHIGEDRFFDVDHADYVADPFGIVERIYDFLGLQLTAQTRQKIEAWHAANASGAHGKHRYTAEQYGLSAAGLRHDYAAYIERYHIKMKS